jgi:hypothetical protein
VSDRVINSRMQCASPEGLFYNGRTRHSLSHLGAAGGDEYNRDWCDRADDQDCVCPCAADDPVIGQDQVRTAKLGQSDRIPHRMGMIERVVVQRLHRVLDVQGDEKLIFDDERVHRLARRDHDCIAELETMDGAASRVVHIDVIRQINPALQRVVTDHRSRFAQGCKLDLLQRAKLSSFRVEQDV